MAANSGNRVPFISFLSLAIDGSDFAARWCIRSFSCLYNSRFFRWNPLRAAELFFSGKKLPGLLTKEVFFQCRGASAGRLKNRKPFFERGRP
jgi:hypothetical protein